ncbi:TerD family protein [Chryseobacterium luquanense]|uniref:TerD family protein n=1 Tax=Chryseobacterium luquanense TaxID=2983766 RepID=A0ABT3Y293_9FLAO|nr:TerD family protein [Chryseobacterium luquanense]MCX8532248.1 TerD family protein [Chryseobacterium luquanense]
MTAILEKSQAINIFEDSKSNDVSYTFGINWGKVEMQKRNFLGIKTRKVSSDIDLDFTCVMFDSQKKAIDWIYSPKYNSWLIQNNFPLGKFQSKDGAFKHYDKSSNENSDYKKLIEVDPAKISDDIYTIFFYLNIDARSAKQTDFSLVDSIELKINRPEIDKTLSEFKIQPNNNKKNKGTLVLGKLYRDNGSWKFMAMDKAIDEKRFIRFTRGF